MKIMKHKLIPKESQDISNDTWHFQSPELLISSWIPEHSGMKVASALSIFDLPRGVQMSKKFDSDGAFKYWYCDLITSTYDETTNTLEITDLILDVVRFPDGVIQIIDVPEYQTYKPQSDWEEKALSQALKNLQKLISRMIQNQFLTDEMIKQAQNLPLINHLLKNELGDSDIKGYPC